MTTGMTVPVSLCVCALKALQNSMMLIPCWPSAGPTGGAGLAWPAGICSLIDPVIFLAIKLGCPESGFFDLPIFQFHRGVPAEDVHGHLQLPAIRLDFLDHAAEIQEWTV